MQEYYKILGINENATDEEVDNAYKALKEEYSKDRFLEGEKGNDAAKNLTKLEEAYSEIKDYRKNNNGQKSAPNLSEVENLIKENKLAEAQVKLDDCSDRNAEWHYLQSVIFYKKNWTNESKKQLEIAISMDSNNAKYKESYEKLKQKTDYSEQFRSGNANYSANDTNRQMGGTDENDCLRWCTTMLCLNCLCNGCCR